MVIYGIRFKETEEIVYVGQAVNLKRRMQSHKSTAKNSAKWVISKAFVKYGWEAFEFIVLDQAICRAQLNLFEINRIAEYNPRYNMTSGGAGKKPTGQRAWNKGMKFDEERLNNLHEAWAERGNKNNNNKPIIHCQTGTIYPSAREAAKDLNLNFSHISSVLHGNRPHTKGHTFSFNLSSPIQPPAEAKSVIRQVKHLETGTIYKDMGEASRALNIPAPNIRKVLIGERPHAGGQHFSFVD